MNNLYLGHVQDATNYEVDVKYIFPLYIELIF